MKIFKAADLGCYYRLNKGVLEYAPMYQDGTFETDEFVDVEPDLVGEEPVTFQDVDTNLYGVYKTVTKILQGEQS